MSEIVHIVEASLRKNIRRTLKKKCYKKVFEVISEVTSQVIPAVTSEMIKNIGTQEKSVPKSSKECSLKNLLF